MRVVANAHLARNHRALAHCGGAGDAGAHDQDHVFADVAVVAHMHQVVDLGPAAECGFAASAPRSMVELAPISTSSSISSVPCCGKLRVCAGLRVAHVAESIRAQHRACVNDDPIAERRSGIEHRARIDAAELADADALANHRARFDARSGADDCASSPMTAQGPMTTSFSPSSTSRAKHGSGMDAARGAEDWA